jgi:hypothetical protein
MFSKINTPLFLSLLFLTSSTKAYVPQEPTGFAPPPDPAQAPGDGSGPFNVQSCSLKDRFETYPTLTVGVGALHLKSWDNGADTMSHYLDATGTDWDPKVATLLEQVPALNSKIQDYVNTQVSGLGDDPAKSFESGWQVWHAWNDATNEPYSWDWYYALGEFSYAVAGAVEKRNGKVTAEFQVHVFDRYNWDNSGKTNSFAGGLITLSHADIGRLHKCGLAREYTVRGSSGVMTL